MRASPYWKRYWRARTRRLRGPPAWSWIQTGDCPSVVLVNPALMARKVQRAGGTDVTSEVIEDVAAILLDACGR